MPMATFVTDGTTMTHSALFNRSSGMESGRFRISSMTRPAFSRRPCSLFWAKRLTAVSMKQSARLKKRNIGDPSDVMSNGGPDQLEGDMAMPVVFPLDRVRVAVACLCRCAHGLRLERGHRANDVDRSHSSWTRSTGTVGVKGVRLADGRQGWQRLSPVPRA